MQNKRLSLSVKDPITLAGFEDLLDRVFKSEDGTTTAETVVNSYEYVTSDRQLTVDQLRGEVLLLRAQLDYALAELAQASQREKRLKLMVASMKDQLSLMPELLNRSVRLEELENYLESFNVRLSRIVLGDGNKTIVAQ